MIVALWDTEDTMTKGFFFCRKADYNKLTDLVSLQSNIDLQFVIAHDIWLLQVRQSKWLEPKNKKKHLHFDCRQNLLNIESWFTVQIKVLILISWFENMIFEKKNTKQR